MDNMVWCLLGMVLLASVNAGRVNQVPQRFYESYSIAPPIRENYETRDLLLYLTPEQVNALEAGGAYVRSQKDEEEPTYQTEQEQEEEQEEEEDADQSNEQEQPEVQEQPQEQQPLQTSELEEIFKILNEQIQEDAKKAENVYEPQGDVQKEEETEEDDEENVEAEQSEEQEEDEETELENTRQIPARFGVPKRQRGEKYFAPSVLAKQKEQTKHARLRSQSNNQKPSRFQQNANKKSQKRRGGNKNENQDYLQNKQRFIPVEEIPQEEVTEKSASEVAQEKLTALLTPILSNDNVVQSIAQHRSKLIQNELQHQTYLQELKEAPRYNNQKYAIEIEKLRQNLAKQNALARAEVLARATPFITKDESDDANVEAQTNQEEGLGQVNNLASFKVRAQKPSASVETVRPIPVPVIKRTKVEAKDAAPVETEKNAPATTPKPRYIHINEPYYVKRIVPLDLSKETPARRPGELTIIRHVWEH